MLKVLFYTDTPNLGGAEKQMLLLASHLKTLGVAVSLAYGAYSRLAELHDEFAKVCENVHVLPTRGKHDPRHYFAMRKILKDGKFDLVHIHLWNPGAGRYAFFASSSVGVPIVTTEHDPFELMGLKKLLKMNCLKKTRRTIVVSRENDFFMRDRYFLTPDRLSVVPNGIDLLPFSGKKDKAELPAGPKDTVITCIAELHERKGHQFLIRAFLDLVRTMPGLQLMLVGTGPEEATLRGQCAGIESIHFLGWRTDIPQILQASDVFVLPSLREAFGFVVLEAMASGVAVIASNVGGPADIIQSGKTGLLVPPGNSEALAEALASLLRNPDQKRAIEAAALERVKTHFTAERMATDTLKIYQAVLGQH